jgi:hypothetical protein
MPIKGPSEVGSGQIYFPSTGKVYDFNSSSTKTLEQTQKEIKISSVEQIVIESLKKGRLDVVIGVSNETIDINLFDDTGYYDGKSGYLVEVFMSSASGLTKMYKNDINNPQTGKREAEGYNNYFYLTVR